MAKSKEIEMLRGRPRFTYRDTRCGIYRLDRKTGKETYLWGGCRKSRSKRKRGRLIKS